MQCCLVFFLSASCKPLVFLRTASSYHPGAEASSLIPASAAPCRAPPCHTCCPHPVSLPAPPPHAAATLHFVPCSEISARRKSQVGTGSRSEKIKTYNYKDSRMSGEFDLIRRLQLHVIWLLYNTRMAVRIDWKLVQSAWRPAACQRSQPN